MRSSDRTSIPVVARDYLSVELGGEKGKRLAIDFPTGFMEAKFVAKATSAFLRFYALPIHPSPRHLFPFTFPRPRSRVVATCFEILRQVYRTDFKGCSISGRRYGMQRTCFGFGIGGIPENYACNVTCSDSLQRLLWRGCLLAHEVTTDNSGYHSRRRDPDYSTRGKRCHR